MHATTQEEVRMFWEEKLNASEMALRRKQEALMERVVCSMVASLPKIQKAEDFFAEFDTDGGGTIDYEELRDGLQRLEIHLDEDEFDELAEFWDHDHSGEIDYVEFSQSFKAALDRHGMPKI